MSFTISISGHAANAATAEGDEQSLIDDVVALVAEHGDKITFATGSFQYSGSVDLVAAAAPPAGTSPPVVTAANFVIRYAGETIEQSKEREFTFNAGKDTPDQVVPFTDDQWNAATPQPNPNAPVADPVSVPVPDPVVVHPADFVVHVANETYHDYVTRAGEAGMTQVLAEADWDNVPATPAAS